MDIQYTWSPNKNLDATNLFKQSIYIYRIYSTYCNSTGLLDWQFWILHVWGEQLIEEDQINISKVLKWKIGMIPSVYNNGYS